MIRSSMTTGKLSPEMDELIKEITADAYGEEVFSPSSFPGFPLFPHRKWLDLNAYPGQPPKFRDRKNSYPNTALAGPKKCPHAENNNNE